MPYATPGRQVPGYVGLILVRCFCQAPQKAKISDKLSDPSEKGKIIQILFLFYLSNCNSRLKLDPLCLRAWRKGVYKCKKVNLKTDREAKEEIFISFLIMHHIIWHTYLREAFLWFFFMFGFVVCCSLLFPVLLCYV